jgi:hypothetical protein
MGERPAVKRRRMVSCVSGQPEEPLRERHDAGDFETMASQGQQAR